jgi:hypothetical protein
MFQVWAPEVLGVGCRLERRRGFLRRSVSARFGTICEYCCGSDFRCLAKFVRRARLVIVR